MQQGNMKLHAKLSKFHIEHTQTEQRFNTHTLYKFKGLSCPKQQLGILQASKQHATAPKHDNKRHGHDVQVKQNKT